jgi:hypothetical protein
MIRVKNTGASRKYVINNDFPTNVKGLKLCFAVVGLSHIHYGYTVILFHSSDRPWDSSLTAVTT